MDGYAEQAPCHIQAVQAHDTEFVKKGGKMKTSAKGTSRRGAAKGRTLDVHQQHRHVGGPPVLLEMQSPLGLPGRFYMHIDRDRRSCGSGSPLSPPQALPPVGPTVFFWFSS